MSPEEKAKELLDKFCKEVFSGPYKATDISNICAKACAIIAVDEIIKVTGDTWSRISDIGELEDYIPRIYWQSVKTHIQNL